jgi:2-polyprenyl-6-methoxyphenol hydroxylase-like FAD-dependent oxidoreductase
MDHSPLIIAGGGLVGLAAAIMLSDRFDRIDIFEKREEPIFPPSMQATQVSAQQATSRSVPRLC